MDRAGISRIVQFAAIAFAVSAALFLKTVRYEFVCMDDPDYVLLNEHMRDGLTGENVKWAFLCRSYADNWHPLTWLSLMADVTAFRASGTVPKTWARTAEEWDCRQSPVRHVMHLHNVLLHAANAALLFILLVQIGRGRLDPIWPLALTLLWAVHPLRTEVVCWVSERKELLSVFFLLLTLILYFRNRYWPALVCAAAAMMAKPVAVSVPAVLVAWDWVICGRLRWVRALPFLALSGFTCFMTMAAQTRAIEVGNDLYLASRLATIFGGPITYIRQTVWPSDIAFLYANVRSIDWLTLVPGVLLVVMIAGGCGWWLLRTLKGGSRSAGEDDPLSLFVFGVAWLYVGLVPMLGIVKVASQEHSDRYTYWIGCGAAVLALMLMIWAKPRLKAAVARVSVQNGTNRDEWPGVRKMTLGILALAIAVLAYMSDNRIPYWRDAGTLFRDTMARSWHPNIARQFATLLSMDGQKGREEAEYWLRGCANNTQSPEAYLELARFLMSKPEEDLGKILDTEVYIEAEMLLNTILATVPDHKEAKRLLGQIEDFRKKRKEAKCTKD